MNAPRCQDPVTGDFGTGALFGRVPCPGSKVEKAFIKLKERGGV